jgi:hypothetical protein
MDSASSCSAHQASTGPHISVAVNCGLGLGSTRRAAAVHGAGKSASTCRHAHGRAQKLDESLRLRCRIGRLAAERGLILPAFSRSA